MTYGTFTITEIPDWHGQFAIRAIRNAEPECDFTFVKLDRETIEQFHRRIQLQCASMDKCRYGER